MRKTGRKTKAAGTGVEAIPRATLLTLLETSPNIVLEYERIGMPGRVMIGRRVHYDLRLVIPWLKRHWLEQRPGKIDSDALERKRAADASIRELELGRLRGRLLDVDEVQAGQIARLVALRRGLLTIPRAAAPALAEMVEPREVEAFLAEKMRELLSQYAEGVQGCSQD